jgi:hypothetical protein
MFPWKPMGPRQISSRASRRAMTKTKSSRRHALRLDVEYLEKRFALTGNIAMTGASVVDSNNNPIAEVNIGEWVDIEADFSTTNLPQNASYRVSFTVNGLTLSSGYVTWGAGVAGTSNWNLYWGAFIATPGTNQVTAVVDPDQSVPETSYADNSFSFTFTAVAPAVSNLMTCTVAQIRGAYGVNSIPNFGSAAADGTGQIIALDEAGNAPTILSDLDGFDRAMSLTTTSTETLYQQYGPASSFVNVYNQNGAIITPYIGTSGSNGVPAEDPTGHWEGEETLDVEWAHAMAPGARIDIIEVNDDANWSTNLLLGDKLAASLPGVSAVSNSWGLNDSSGDAGYDSSTFVTPSGHVGVTFLTASNDNGANVYPSPPSDPPPSAGFDGYYPATSPNVVSVGGTELTLNSDAYGSETAWSYPAPSTVVDNGSGSYSQSGSWTSQSGGYSGNYSTAAGSSASSASWRLAISPSNTGWGTEVCATWTPSPGNATNATYTIYDGTQASGTILGTVVVNQTKSPVGTSMSGFQFQELGVFFPTLSSSGDGTLTVVLDASSANGTVVADAVGAAQAWATTGGPSSFEPEPSYQLPFQSTGDRTTPDVSFDASQNSGVDTYFMGSLNYGSFGTSLGSPCWAGLVAIANQGRVAYDNATFNGPSNSGQILQALYSLPSADFNGITTGYNGFSAGPRYDFLTGLGSPIANLLVSDLATYGVGRLAITNEPPLSTAPGKSFGLTVAVETPSGTLITNYSGSVTIALANNPGGGTLGGVLTTNAAGGIATFSGLTIEAMGTGYTIEATSASLEPALTVPFNVALAQSPIGPTIVTAAAAAPNPVTGTMTVLSVAAADPAGASSLIYTWETIGGPSAPTVFSDNDSNSAARTTVNFASAGVYEFQVTVVDPLGYFATSDVTVTVDQSLTSIKAAPDSPAVVAGSTVQFRAAAFDQFGDPLSPEPLFTWSVQSGGGTIGAATGLYIATTSSASAEVRAAIGALSATATVKISPAPKAKGGIFVHYSQSGGPKSPVYGTFTIANMGLFAIDGWVLEFTLKPGIISISNASLVSQRRGRYAVRNVASDIWILPGASVSFVIRRSPARRLPLPTKLLFNNVPVV